MSLNKIIEKIDRFLKIPSVIGSEFFFLSRMAQEFGFYGYEISLNPNLLAVRKKATKNKTILTAHADRHGIVVNENGNFEYASFKAYRDADKNNDMGEETFIRGGESFKGEEVCAYDDHGNLLGEAIVTDFSYDLDKKKLLFEVKGFPKLPKNTQVTYKHKFNTTNGQVSSQIDNCVSMAVIHQLIEDGFDGTALFATQEEIGNSWKPIIEYLSTFPEQSKRLVTLDVTPYNNSEAMDQGRVILRNRDQIGMFNPELCYEIKFACQENNIPYEVKDKIISRENSLLPEGSKPKSIGITELGIVVANSKGKFNGTTFQIPTINYHSVNETTSQKSLGNYYEALKGFI